MIMKVCISDGMPVLPLNMSRYHRIDSAVLDSYTLLVADQFDMSNMGQRFAIMPA